MPGFILIADAQQVLGQELLPGFDKGQGGGRIFFELDFPDEQTGTCAGLRRGDLGIFLGEKTRTSHRTAKGHLKKRFRIFLGMGPILCSQGIQEEPVCRGGMVDIVGAFFPSFDFQAADMRYLRKLLHKDVQGKVLARKESAFIPFLLVHASAGLDATPPEAALAAQIAGPVASAGNAPAQGSVDENFKAHILRGFLIHEANLIDGQLAGKDDAADAQRMRSPYILHAGDIGERRKMDFPSIARLAGDVDEPDVLYDERMGLGVPLQAVDEPSRRAKIRFFNEGIERDIDLASMLVGEVDHGGDVRYAEIFRAGPCGKIFKSHVRCVCSCGNRGKKAGLVPGRREDFRQCFFHHDILGDGWASIRFCLATAIISLILLI